MGGDERKILVFFTFLLFAGIGFYLARIIF